MRDFPKLAKALERQKEVFINKILSTTSGFEESVDRKVFLVDFCILLL